MSPKIACGDAWGYPARRRGRRTNQGCLQAKAVQRILQCFIQILPVDKSFRQPVSRRRNCFDGRWCSVSVLNMSNAKSFAGEALLVSLLLPHACSGADPCKCSSNYTIHPQHMEVSEKLGVSFRRNNKNLETDGWEMSEERFRIDRAEYGKH